jgi:hypothetical protein
MSNTSRRHKGDWEAAPLLITGVVEQGQLAERNSGGYYVSASIATTNRIVGLSLEETDGSAGYKAGQIAYEGKFWLPASGTVAQTWIGVGLYAASNTSVALSGVLTPGMKLVGTGRDIDTAKNEVLVDLLVRPATNNDLTS